MDTVSWNQKIRPLSIVCERLTAIFGGTKKIVNSMSPVGNLTVIIFTCNNSAQSVETITKEY